MSSTLSPGAALLRGSRLFSLPTKAVPQAPGDISRLVKGMAEQTTQPFPTLQAIGSPRATRDQGDWGLKRPMPYQATNAKFNPLIRVYELDTVETVTDYGRATDHNMALQRWQAINTPITSQTNAEQRQHIVGKSVFEEAADIIHIEPTKRHTLEDKRWKFEGPWLAGIPEGSFQNYVKKKVRTRRQEFREFLRAQLAADKNANAAADAMDRGSDKPTTTLTAADVTDEQLTEYLRSLRHDRPLLFRLVGKFLDLAPVEPSDKIYQNLARSTSSLSGGFLSPLTGLGDLASGAAAPSSSGTPTAANRGHNSGNPWAHDGPPISHPSAGLSYLRTAAFIDNHPVYGPQKAHPPIDARVLVPRSSVGSWSAKLGVAGVATDSPFGEAAYANTRHNPTFNNNRAIPALSVIDPTIYGGAKIPVRVAVAKINSHGRIIMTVAEPEPESVLVMRELENKEKIYSQPSRLQSTRADSQPRGAASGRFVLGRPARSIGLNNNNESMISSAQNYGLN